MPLNDDLRARYSDLLFPEAESEDEEILELLHRSLATPEPPERLRAAIRRQARNLRRADTAPHEARRLRERGVLPPDTAGPVLPEPSVSSGRSPGPLRVLTGMLAALLALGALVLVYQALLPSGGETPAGPASPTIAPGTPTSVAPLTANQLRARLRYPLFVPTELPPGTVAAYSVDGPGPEALVTITFSTPDGTPLFVLVQGPADRIPPSAGGEPIQLANGTLARYFADFGKTPGSPALEWTQDGTLLTLIGGTYGRNQLVAVADSLSAETDLVLLDARLLPTPTTRPAPSPTVPPARAIPGHLALALGDQLLLDGSRLTEPGGVSTPVWSPSGDWVAYRNIGQRTVVVRAASGASRTDLATAIPNGPLRLFAWSPVEDLLAIAPDNGGLYLYRPANGESWAIPNVDGIVGSLAWSPSGDSLALVAMSDPAVQQPDELVVVAVADGAARVVVRGDQAHLELAGWWPDGNGLLYWEYPLASQSLAADGVPLRSLDLTTGTVTTLTTMLPDREALAIGIPSKAEPAIVLAGGQGRQHWTGKHLVHCTLPTGTCQVLPVSNEERVTLFPSWSPDAGLVAFVEAPTLSEQPAESEALRSWIAARRLRIVHLDGSPAFSVPPELEAGILQARWVTSQTLLVLQAPAPGTVRLLWLDAASGTVVELADLSGAIPDPPVDAYGAPIVRIADIVAWHP